MAIPTMLIWSFSLIYKYWHLSIISDYVTLFILTFGLLLLPAILTISIPLITSVLGNSVILTSDGIKIDKVSSFNILRHKCIFIKYSDIIDISRTIDIILIRTENRIFQIYRPLYLRDNSVNKILKELENYHIKKINYKEMVKEGKKMYSFFILRREFGLI